jgi:hypothetical protein
MQIYAHGCEEGDIPWVYSPVAFNRFGQHLELSSVDLFVSGEGVYKVMIWQDLGWILIRPSQNVTRLYIRRSFSIKAWTESYLGFSC